MDKPPHEQSTPTEPSKAVPRKLKRPRAAIFVLGILVGLGIAIAWPKLAPLATCIQDIAQNGVPVPTGTDNLVSIDGLRAILAAFAALGLSVYAYGAEIHDSPNDEWARRGWDITVNGEIVPGDDVTFQATLNRVNRTNPDAWPIIVWLNSPGGNVVTSERVADLINQFHLWTHVDGLCASSCFMLFMAGIDRKFAPDAVIGVHSASNEQGNETAGSLAVTMITIRKAQAYAADSATVIPPSIIGKLAGTLGTDISWLSREELQQIGASMDPPPRSCIRHTHTGTATGSSLIR